MDNTELHYLTYDPEQIWTEMITNYIAAGGDILYPGDEKEMLLRSVQADIVQVLAGVDNALRMQTLRYAVGEYLDVIGEMRGCIRIPATAAAAKVKINKKNKTLQITKITPADKKAQKAIKKLTKGDNALQFKITPYVVSNESPVTAKVSKSNELKKVTIDINGSKYKCGKDEYSYEPTSKTITFKGENLTGSYTLK